MAAIRKQLSGQISLDGFTSHIAVGVQAPTQAASG
jgi:hypothetical protein